MVWERIPSGMSLDGGRQLASTPASAPKSALLKSNVEILLKTRGTSDLRAASH